MAGRRTEKSPLLRRLGLCPSAGRRRAAHLVVAGALDVATAPSLVRLVGELAEDHDRREVTLDLGKVRFLDPAGLAAVHRAHESLGGRLSVVPPSGGPARHFVETLGVGELLQAA